MGKAVSESLYDLSCLLPVLSPLVLLPFFSFPLGWTQAVGSSVLRSFAGHGSRRRGDSSPLQGRLCLENPELTIFSPKASVKLSQFILKLVLDTVHPESPLCQSAAKPRLLHIQHAYMCFLLQNFSFREAVTRCHVFC